MRLREALPQAPGAYRWFYADVSAQGWSAVFIFMLGSLFSPRYSVAARRGGSPLSYSAVNFALYHRGERQCWVLSEYPLAAVQGQRVLRIGGSRLVYARNGTVRMEVGERTAPWGRRVQARLELRPLTPSGPEVELVPGLPHYWQALAPRSHARLEVPSAGVAVEGLGYHDGNHGEELLGERLERWSWYRTHGPEDTVVDYVPEGARPVRVVASAAGTRCERQEGAAWQAPLRRTGWGLQVPQPMRLLESSPFYARVEARSGERETLGEVADFRRFHSPFIRWMAHFRTRVERAA